MKYWFRGKRGGLLSFVLIAGLVAGGLGWATAAALRLEQEQLAAAPRVEQDQQLRLALWRLDSLVAPALARETSRPYHHYSAVYAPSPLLRNDGRPWHQGSVLQLSPLLSEELPDWMLLHFQAGAEAGWRSPQVLSETLAQRLRRAELLTHPANVTPQRRQIQKELADHLPPQDLVARVQQRDLKPTLNDILLVPANESFDNQVQVAQTPNQGAYEYQKRGKIQQQNFAQQPQPQSDDLNTVTLNMRGNGEDWLSGRPVKPARSEPVLVRLGSMVPLWLPADDRGERLALVRLVQVGPKEACQGILLDWPRLQGLLADEVRDLLPDARLLPVHEGEESPPERTMTALPVQIDPGPALGPPGDPGWTPLRIGLALAWTAALVALLAVGLGGWSLLDLSERRIRFVSAVTHELRTPLTTLRLYLDMLTGGLVQEERQRTEYLQTLHAEADRLHRLVGNVLDFSRLENQRPRLEKTPAALGEVLEQVRTTWERRCQDAEKELLVENPAGDLPLLTDVRLVQQVLGNLIDNACKYSRGADDRRIWLRATAAGPHRLVLEVEDRGPGVPPRECRSIFRPFRRGRAADVTAGGVGLGLALADRWARLLGGRLTLRTGGEQSGACFRLELPTD
jgi:signal transduction histidine kinase